MFTHTRWLMTVGACLLAAFFGFLGMLFWTAHIMRDPNYPAQLGDPTLLLQDRSFLLHNHRCDIVIDGDSTALVGIDPRIVTAQTGLSTCNIAASRPVFDTLKTYSLDTFLENNPKPRVIFFQLGPEFFYRRLTWDGVILLPPYMMLFRDASRSMLLRSLLLHPSEDLTLVGVVMKRKIFPLSPEEAARSRAVFAHTVDYYDRSGGRVDVEEPGLTDCSYPPLPMHGALDPAYVRELRDRYRQRGIVTIVNVAPIPFCDPQLLQFQRDLTMLDNSEQTLPPGVFIGGGRHMTRDGAAQHSVEVARQIQSALAISRGGANDTADHASN